MTTILPEPDEYEALAPQPGSPVWRAFNDGRMLAVSGYATLLQVALPTVGHGVHQYSSFTKDPWGRLLRTLDYVHGTIYGGPELAGTIGRRVREMHKSIKGTRPDGERYFALDPSAFAWVHATLAEAIVRGHARFGRAMTRAQQEAFWSQWLEVGRLIGVRPQDLPATWSEFPDYFDRVVEEELEWTPAVPEVMRTLTASPPPDVPGLPPALWRALRSPMALQLRLNTVGLLPPLLRERLDLPFSRGDEVAFRALAAASRASGPLLFGPLKQFGPNYVRWRRAALARGDVAAGTPRSREEELAAA